MATKYQVKKASQPTEPQEKPAFKAKVKVREIHEEQPEVQVHAAYPFKNRNVWVERDQAGIQYLSVSSQGIGIRTWGHIDGYSKKHSLPVRFR